MSLIIAKKERFSEAQRPTWMLKATLHIGVTLFWQNVNVLSYIFSVTELVVFALGSAAFVWIPAAKKWLMKICHMEPKRQKQLLKTCSHWAELPSKRDCIRFAASWTSVTRKWLNPVVDTKVASVYSCMQPEIFPPKAHFSVAVLLQGSWRICSPLWT